MRGQGAELPCGVWGSAPAVPRATNSKRKVHKGAGSEASLPVTLRSRRSAPQAALSNIYAVSRQMGATGLPASIAAFARKQRISPLRRRQGGNGNRRSLRSLPCPLRVATNEVDFFRIINESINFPFIRRFSPCNTVPWKKRLSGDILQGRNAVGEGRHPRGRKRRRAHRQGFAALRAKNRHDRAVPRRGVYAAVREWENHPK